MTCVKNKQIDFFISEHIKAKALRNDTAILLKKIFDYKGIISYQDQNAKALNIINADQNTIITTQKKDYVILLDKYQKSERRASRRGKAVLIFIGTTLVAGGIAVLKP